MKTSNAFTLTRIVIAPFFFALYFIPIWTGRFACASALAMLPLLAFAEFTDFLDGRAARKNKEVSDFGKLFDPFADVIVHLTTFFCLMFSFSPAAKGYVPRAVCVLVLYREFAMNFLRMAAAKNGTAIAARKGGKLKTVFYVATGFVCLVPECALRVQSEFPGACAFVSSIADSFAKWKTAGLAMSCASLAMCYISFIDYIAHFKGALKGA